MSYEFIDNNAIDGVKRKQIRSYVMRGKNTGKRYFRAPKDRLTIGARPIRQKDSVRPLMPWDSSTDVGSISIPRSPGNVLCYFTFPCELTPHMEMIINRCKRRTFFTPVVELTGAVLWAEMQSIFPVDFCKNIDPLRSVWFRFLQTSETFFHNTLAVAQQCVDNSEGREQSSYEALVYLAKTYRSLNNEFQTSKLLSDPTLAVVASLLFHGNIVYQSGTSKTHLDALERIIAIRGGTESFSGESTFLVQKICRGDIDYSIHQGSLPRFFRDQYPYDVIPAPLAKDAIPNKQCLRLKHDLSNIGPQLRAIHEDLMRFCKFLNNISESTRLCPTEFEDALISIAYRLLHLYPLGMKRPESEPGNAYHLGAIAIVWTALFESGRLHRTPYNLLARRLHDVVEALTLGGTHSSPLSLWLLFVGGISVIASVEKAWLHGRIKLCISGLQLEHWYSVQQLLGTFPWINLIHDKPAQRLWQAAVM